MSEQESILRAPVTIMPDADFRVWVKERVTNIHAALVIVRERLDKIEDEITIPPQPPSQELGGRTSKAKAYTPQRKHYEDMIRRRGGRLTEAYVFKKTGKTMSGILQALNNQKDNGNGRPLNFTSSHALILDYLLGISGTGDSFMQFVNPEHGRIRR